MTPDVPQVSGVGQDVARMWEMAIQHALMPAVSTGVSKSSHCTGHSKSAQTPTPTPPRGHGSKHGPEDILYV